MTAEHDQSPAAQLDPQNDASIADSLIEQLTDLQSLMADTESRFRKDLEIIHPDQRPSARNLLHYVSLRRRDLRPLQERLAVLGLSSLGRCESHVMDNVHAVLGMLAKLWGREFATPPGNVISFSTGRELSKMHTRELLGPHPEDRGAHIMVTMPSEASKDYELVRDLLAAGMSCVRINCAHDDETAWSGMIENLRKAETELGRSCRVTMDLAGPKIRTGPISAGPSVLRWRPKRDSFGRTVAPARIWMTGAHTAAPPLLADATLPTDGDWLDRVKIGDQVRFRDTRGHRRILDIVGASNGGFWAECHKTSYLTSGIRLQHVDCTGTNTARDEGRVGVLPDKEQFIVVYRGDRILVTDPGKIGSPAKHDDLGKLVEPATIGCTTPEVFAAVRDGERVLFDDGKIGGVIEAVYDQHLVIEITQARDRGEKLRADKGVNFPDSSLKMPALTDKDCRDLKFVVRHADAVSYSFVRRPDDVFRLQEELVSLGKSDFGIILKIENQKAVQHLARILLAVMRNPIAGVMIARGDLGVECGWQRLAEVQEQILWMCEAAHMPVVWATQVLENLAKKGLPSRSEVTDAAMGVRAECVMLNKGSHIVETVGMLDDILRRMQDHQIKKRPMMRRLSLAEDLLPIKPPSIDAAI